MANRSKAKINNEKQDFYDYLYQNIDNVVLELKKLSTIYKKRLEKGVISQSEYDEKLQLGIIRIQTIKENNSDIFEFIKETEESYIFKLTDWYKDILKEIIRDPTNFR